MSLASLSNYGKDLGTLSLSNNFFKACYLSSLVKLSARLNNNSWRLLTTTQYFLHHAIVGFITIIE